METYKIIGIIGASILAAGALLPARLVRTAGDLAHYVNYQTNAVVLVVLAFIALILVFRGSPAKWFLFGLVTLASVAWIGVRPYPSVRAVENQVVEWTAKAAANPFLQQATSSIANNTPWWMMLGGSALLVIAALMQIRRV